MSHVSIGPILNTDKWRVTRGTTALEYDSEASARSMASALSGGDRIAETIFHDPKEPEAPMEEFLDVEVEERVSDLTINELKAKLSGGDYDEILDEIEEAERAGSGRIGAIGAIEARREDISS